ncbi:MAG: uracil-DNA glycosylase family protein [Spirochaetia bacterium]|nr:uracil-DNA glycosylase family protein [Spirochaetia bacterium]
MADLLTDIAGCRVCEKDLPLGPRPVVRASASSRVLIVGQAPGKKVHASGIPWNDPSGDRLRAWMGVDTSTFYDNTLFALIPMGFCYPGKGSGGDLPPRPECAPLWHNKLAELMPNVELTLLVGQYAQQYYLSTRRKPTLTQTVRSFEDYLPRFIPLVHPSPRNQRWLKNNPWFEAEIVPLLRGRVARILERAR